jgi:hypothetical protein
MKKSLLSFGGAALITAALLDLIFCSGIGRPLPWFRAAVMAAGGVVCLYLLIRFRKEL